VKLATLCSGIDGFGLAGERFGMEVVFQSEVDRDCQRVLKRHWPNVERTNDVCADETSESLRRLRPDVVAFGSPCQDLSVAGKRGGISAQRSGLFFRCVELCFECEAGVVLWENVPGVFSNNDGRDFAAVLEAFTGFRPEVPEEGWRDTGVCVGPLYSVAWAVLDAQWFGLAQRRKRVFLVASLGDRGGPYEILSIGDSLPWDSPPRRETGARTADCLTSGVASGSGVSKPGRWREDDVNLVSCPAVSPALTAKDYKSTREDIAEPAYIAHTLRAEGFDASEDGTGRGTPIVPVIYAIQERAVSDNLENGPQGKGFQSDIGFTLEGRSKVQAVAYQCYGSNVGPMETLRRGSGNETSGVPFISVNAYSHQYRQDSINSIGRPADALCPSRTRMSQGYHTGPSTVRRLLPIECERLMGFQDDFTKYDDAGKEISDSARYRMLGNSVAVPVVEWILKRIAGATP
jgi:DNA (cytosine-5)-methyltransferase 1